MTISAFHDLETVQEKERSYLGSAKIELDFRDDNVAHLA